LKTFEPVSKVEVEAAQSDFSCSTPNPFETHRYSEIPYLILRFSSPYGDVYSLSKFADILVNIVDDQGDLVWPH
jgi:hypothetical protein